MIAMETFRVPSSALHMSSQLRAGPARQVSESAQASRSRIHGRGANVGAPLAALARRSQHERGSSALARYTAAVAALGGLARARVRRRAKEESVGASTVAGAPVSILVVGGTGRVGGSTARWLHKLCQESGMSNIHIAVGGRSKDRYAEFVDRWAASESTKEAAMPDLVQINLQDAESVKDALSKGWNLVVHTAGPFQGIERPVLLEEAIKAGVPYVDVCDDTDLCGVAKELNEEAQAAGITALVSTGIWPGASALMVAEAVDRLGGAQGIEDVDMTFYTAGTGGAGPTIVSATFLLLAEPPLTYKDGSVLREEPWDARRLVDFGPPVGEQYVHLLDEPEVYTCHRSLGIPNMRSSFGTAPDIWNWLFAAVKMLPKEVLRNRELMQAVSVFSMPIINVADMVVGANNAMRVDVKSKDGRTVTLRITHPDLEDCVGQATAAFALEVLQRRVPPGVWFPVEMTDDCRKSIFKTVKRESLLWDL